MGSECFQHPRDRGTCFVDRVGVLGVHFTRLGDRCNARVEHGFVLVKLGAREGA
nr:hypothetical protein [Candidatus Sigynarchaeota archaeon]